MRLLRNPAYEIINVQGGEGRLSEPSDKLHHPAELLLGRFFHDHMDDDDLGIEPGGDCTAQLERLIRLFGPVGCN